jgi:hypothetical protein
MKNVVNFAAVAEGATGLALLIVPSLVGQLLLGDELSGGAISVARVTGISLIGLGIACWPGLSLIGMLTYSALVTLYLTSIGLTGEATGVLLWPAVVLHMILTALLTRAAMGDRKRTASCTMPLISSPIDGLISAAGPSRSFGCAVHASAREGLAVKEA